MERGKKRELRGLRGHALNLASKRLLHNRMAPEKKCHVLTIPHIFLQNAQQSGNDKELDFVYGLIKPLLVLCCEYLVEV